MKTREPTTFLEWSGVEEMFVLIRVEPPVDRRIKELDTDNFIDVEDEEEEARLEKETNERVARIRAASIRDPKEIHLAEQMKDIIGEKKARSKSKTAKDARIIESRSDRKVETRTRRTYGAR